MKDTPSSSAGKNSVTRSSNHAPAVGIQLLSPTSLHVARQYATPAKGFVSRVTTAKGADFDFNSFTLESVRSTLATSQHEPSSNCSSGSGRSSSSSAVTSNSSNTTTNTSKVAQRKASIASSSDGVSCLSSQAEKFADAQDALDSASSFHTMRSTEDFDALEHRRTRHPSSSSITAASSSVMTSSSSFSKQQSVSSSSLAATSMSERGGVAAPRKKTSVVMAGWLQKRKGLVLKRWKAYYCLLRDDDQLCLYTSEDTINGRIAQRFQVLRVLLTDRSDAFHIIGVSGDGTPHKDEFRALHSVDWSSWFHALRGYLDAVSLQGVMHRKPELSELSLVSSSGRDSTDAGFGYEKTGRPGTAVGTMLGGKSSSSSSSSNNNNNNHSLSSSSDNQRKSFVKSTGSARASFDLSSIEEQLAARSTISTLAALSAYSSGPYWTNQLSGADDAKTEVSTGSDCPIIGAHEPQVPMLEREQHRASGSTVSRDSDAVQPSPGFSW